MICLAYHQILEQVDGDHRSVSTAHFREHLSLIQQSSHCVLDPALLSANVDIDGIILTFDDGTADHFTTVKPLLREFGMKAIFYVPTARIGQEGYITRHELRELDRDGHTIGSHSDTHPRLTEVSPAQLIHEMEHSATVLQELLGKRPAHFAPPGGLYDPAIQDAAREGGYRFFRTMDWGYNRRLDPMRIEVVPMTNAWGLFFLKRALSDNAEWAFKLACRTKRIIRSAQMRLQL